MNCRIDSQAYSLHGYRDDPYKTIAPVYCKNKTSFSFNHIFLHIKQTAHYLITVVVSIAIIFFSLLSKNRTPTNNQGNRFASVSVLTRYLKIIGLFMSVLGLSYFLITRLRLLIDQQEARLNKEEKPPCKPVITVTDFYFENREHCTHEDIDKAADERIQLLEKAYEKQKIDDEEQSRRIKEVAKEYKTPSFQKLEKEVEELNERIRRRENPTPEEQEEDERNIEEATYEAMNQWFKKFDDHFPKIDDKQGCPENSAKLSPTGDYLKLTPIELALDTKVSAFCREHAEIILGVDQEASKAVKKKRFYELSLAYHPDKNSHKNASKAFELIRTAYETLTQ